MQTRKEPSEFVDDTIQDQTDSTKWNQFGVRCETENPPASRRTKGPRKTNHHLPRSTAACATQYSVGELSQLDRPAVQRYNEPQMLCPVSHLGRLAHPIKFQDKSNLPRLSWGLNESQRTNAVTSFFVWLLSQDHLCSGLYLIYMESSTQLSNTLSTGSQSSSPTLRASHMANGPTSTTSLIGRHRLNFQAQKRLNRCRWSLRWWLTWWLEDEHCLRLAQSALQVTRCRAAAFWSYLAHHLGNQSVTELTWNILIDTDLHAHYRQQRWVAPVPQHRRVHCGRRSLVTYRTFVA